MSDVGPRKLACIANHTFLVGPLRAGGAVIDAGANAGLFCNAVSAQFGVRVLAIEPHPSHFSAIPTGPGVEKVNAAVATVNGPLKFQLDDNFEGSRLGSNSTGGEVTVTGRTLESLADEYRLDRLSLIKLDIEGAELDALDGLSDKFLSRIAQFTIEFHDFAGYFTSARVEESLRRLEHRGFVAIKFSRKFYGDTLIANRDLCRLSRADVWWLQNISRNARGASRWLRRKIGGPVN